MDNLALIYSLDFYSTVPHLEIFQQYSIPVYIKQYYQICRYKYYNATLYLIVS